MSALDELNRASESLRGLPQWYIEEQKRVDELVRLLKFRFVNRIPTKFVGRTSIRDNFTYSKE